MIFIPFNFQPFATGRASASYTVPAGYYSRILITVYATASASASTVSATTNSALINSYGVISDSKNETFELWLKDGDAITSSSSNASGSATLTYTTTDQYIDSQSSTTTVTLSIGGSSFATIAATASAYVAITSTTSGSATLNYASFAGASSILINYSEYPVIS